MAAGVEGVLVRYHRIVRYPSLAHVTYPRAQYNSLFVVLFVRAACLASALKITFRSHSCALSFRK